MTLLPNLFDGAANISPGGMCASGALAETAEPTAKIE
jgi:hypothetical protein